MVNVNASILQNTIDHMNLLSYGKDFVISNIESQRLNSLTAFHRNLLLDYLLLQRYQFIILAIKANNVGQDYLSNVL